MARGAPAVTRGLASGADPAATFPNSHLLRPVAARAPAKWSGAQPGSPLEELRRAVHEEDWERAYAEGLTRLHMRAEWCASSERCSLLQWLTSAHRTRRVLEVGSFCGAATLALAGALPEDGEVLSLELDPFVVNFGRRFQLRSLAGLKIRHIIGPAAGSLERLAQEAREGAREPFDLAVVDADKEGMQQYFQLLWDSPGLLADGAVVCVDTTPFKGQPPVRYVRYGFPYRWESSSGLEEIAALRRAVQAAPEFAAHEFGGLLVVQRARAGP